MARLQQRLRAGEDLLPPEAGQTFTSGQIINIDIPCGRFGEYLRASESDPTSIVTCLAFTRHGAPSSIRA